MTANVVGRVCAADGGPVAGAAVAVVSAPVPLPDIAQITGSDGGFDIEAPEVGTYVLAVHAPDGAVRQVSVEVGLADPPPVEVILP
ncbi:MAG: carboxypeptidase regulatory-like domain-containing protein [Allosphingosinicella sp.]